jgi:hypothetical protein
LPLERSARGEAPQFERTWGEQADKPGHSRRGLNANGPAYRTIDVDVIAATNFSIFQPLGLASLFSDPAPLRNRF